jgi:hypothetical protein
MKRTKGIMGIKRLKWTKKTVAHLLLDLRLIERMQPGS